MTEVSPGWPALVQMVLRLFLDKGDALLCEANTYPHIAESLVQPAGLRTCPVAMDAGGMLPGALRETLEGFASRGERPPRLLYTVPVGQNPTGAPCFTLATVMQETFQCTCIFT